MSIPLNELPYSSSCQLPTGEKPEIDIGEFVAKYTPHQFRLPYILLALLLLIVAYLVVECFLGKQIPMARFFLGPQSKGTVYISNQYDISSSFIYSLRM